jgi:dTDP-4-amino-4,6-dideoxygalactose transaminase
LIRALDEIEGLDPLPEDPRVTRHARHLLILRYDPACFAGQPVERFVAALAAEGITPVSQGYVPLHHTPAIRKRYKSASTMIQAAATCRAGEHAASIPCGSRKTRCWAMKKIWRISSPRCSQIKHAWRKAAWK